jgi:type I restriction enzyme S subunit
VIRPTDLQNDWVSLRTGLAKTRGIITSAYMRLRTTGLLDPEYGRLLLHAYDLKKVFYGLGSDLRQNLSWRDFKYLPCLVPPPDEQCAIVRFLDHYDRLTRRYIRAQRRLIELLEEQKQAIIQRAVTRGLDPDVPLKDSGVEWLGKIPAHWEARKLKRIAHFNPSKSENLDFFVNGKQVVFLPMEKVSANGDIDCSEKRPIEELWNGYTYFRRFDVVIAKITPCFENGKGAFLKSLETEIGFGSTEFIVLRASSRVDPQFLYQLTMTPIFRQLGADAMTGAAGQQRVPIDFVRNFAVPLPPIDEQRQLLSSVHERLASCNEAITRTQRQINLVREYRTRLIADVVTGKLDVRGVPLPALDADDEPDAEEANG